jgi:hypothetical protein
MPKNYLLPSLCIIILLSGCGLNPTLATPTPTPDVQPITSPYRPFRVVQVCLDTPPFYPAAIFHQAVNKIADWIEADVSVNQGGFVVYVGEISSKSFQSNVIDPIQVPAIPADAIQPALIPTYTPQAGENGFHASDVQATRDATNKQTYSSWQNQLKSNHEAVAAALHKVKEATMKLRSLVPPYDNKAADVYGCLADASQHFQNTQGEHDLIIASAFVNNTVVNESSDISLSRAHVRGIYRDCSQAQVCAEHDKEWKNAFIQMGSNQDVTFYDPLQSKLLPPLF